MKRLILLILILGLLTGCGSRALPETTQPAEAPTETTLPTETTAPAEPTAEEKEVFTLTFATEDREGTAWTQENLSGYKGVILNFWEPWCGPCVGEMPDLEKLYENFKDRGLLVIGVYASQDMEEEVTQVLENAGVTYPILKYCPEFDILQTGYVPTTVLLDGEGHLLAQPFSGAMGYEDWAELAEMMV